MRLILIFLAMMPGLASSAVPDPQVAHLLVALGKPEVDQSTSYYWRIGNEPQSAQLERMFSEKMAGLGYRVHVAWGATARDLRKALDGPDSAVVMWMGHGSRTAANGALDASGLIPDAERVDVAPLFKSVHPNVRWLGIVGCYSNGILSRFRADGFYRFNPVLHLEGSDGTAFPSLDLEMNSAQAYISLATVNRDYPDPICDWEKAVTKKQPMGRWLHVERVAGQGASSLLISRQGRFIGFLSRSEPEKNVWIPSDVDLSLLEVGQLDLSPRGAIEPLRITNPDDPRQEWRPLADRRTGATIGLTRNVYRPAEGQVPAAAERPQPSNCLR